MDGERIMQPAGARHDADEFSHIFSPNGFIDDTWWHRGYYAYGNGVQGGSAWYQTLTKIIGGKIICGDDENIYSFGRESKYNKWTLPLEFLLTATSKTERKSQNQEKKRKGKREIRDLSNPYVVKWTTKLPMWVKAMFVTDDTLVLSGPRDLYDEEKAVAAFKTNDGIFSTQQEHMEGKHGSLLKVINKHDGKEISSVELPYMPTWDGMITANGKVYMTTSDGHVVCFEVK